MKFWSRGGALAAVLLLLAWLVPATGFGQGTATQPGALGMYNCDWGIGQMPGCVALRHPLPNAMTRLDLDLFNLAAESAPRATPTAQQAAIAQLNTGLVHMLVQDDTVVYCAQLVLNGGIGAPLCDAARPMQGAGASGERMVINAVDNDPRNRLFNCASNRVPFGRDGMDLSRCFTFVYPVPAGGIRSARLHVAMKVLEGSTDWVIMAHDRPSGGPPSPPPVAIKPQAPTTATGCQGFAGNWNSDFGPIPMSVSGNRASGSYTNPGGTIDGSVAGNVLEGRWVQRDRSGQLRFVLAADGRSFTGTWREANGSGGGAWNGNCTSSPVVRAAPPPIAKQEPLRPPAAGGGQYLGCFKDQGDPAGTAGRDLNGAIHSDRGMTTAMCVNECRAKNFAYAGTQYSSYCFCGSSYGKSGAANNCNMKCAGNAGQTCGGGYANSVYATGIAAAAPAPPPPIARPETPPPPIARPETPRPPVVKSEPSLPPIARPQPPPSPIARSQTPPPPIAKPELPLPPIAKPELPLPPIAMAEPPRAPAPETQKAPGPLAAKDPPVVPTDAPPKPQATGDCDGDGRLTALDARCALEMSVQLAPVNMTADMDNNKDVTSRDAFLILQRAVGK